MTSMHGLSTPDAILRKALEKETQARDFYADLAAGCSVLFVKELLLRLESEEAKHVHLIQSLLGQLESGKHLG